jgi:alanine racemase
MHRSAEPPLQSFYRPCWTEINSEALRENVRRLRLRLKPETALLAVVKANAYGHGLVTAAKAVLEAGALLLGVSSLEEGDALRAAGLQAPTLILGSLNPFDNFPVLFEKKLTPTVASLESAEALEGLALKRGERLPVHLKIDSGFGRIGVSLPNALEFIVKVSSMKGLVLEGLYTHFAASDIDADYTHEQANAFLEIVEKARAQGIRPRFVHLANSSALIRFPETHGTLVRPGLAIYGVAPYAGADAEVELSPVLSWKTKIIFLKTLPEGSPVSYARTWTASRPTRVATLAVGYADGLPRLLSNQGQVLIGGRRAPILGRVTMDMTMVDVTESPECHVGDEAVLIGRQGNERLGVEDMARAAQTNAYEILCGISARVPRVAV